MVCRRGGGTLAARRVKSARPRRRVQGEPIERRAQWLVVGQRMRLEGREATHPLRPGRRRLTRNRRSGEVPFGVALPARLGLILKGPEQPAPAKVPLHAPDHALEHLPHLAGPEVGEPLPDEFAALLAPGAIEDDHVQVRIQSQIGRGPLNHGDRAAPPAEPTLLRRASGVERQHRLDYDAREPAEQRCVLGQAAPPRERERQHPLAQPALWRQHPLDRTAIAPSPIAPYSVSRLSRTTSYSTVVPGSLGL